MADRTRAEESVAARFTRLMNATTSRWGMLTDPPIIAMGSGVLFIFLLAAIRLDAGAPVVNTLVALAALPTLGGVAISLGLVGARRRVIDWLAGLPFPVENMNAVLNGLGEELELTFVGEGPAAPELNAALDQVSPDAFITKAPGSDSADPAPAPEGPAVIEIRIGVVDSKRNPASSNYQRFERVRALVDGVLVPLHARLPLATVRIK